MLVAEDDPYLVLPRHGEFGNGENLPLSCVQDHLHGLQFFPLRAKFVETTHVQIFRQSACQVLRAGHPMTTPQQSPMPMS